jgi:hypothetical protein
MGRVEDVVVGLGGEERGRHLEGGRALRVESVGPEVPRRCAGGALVSAVGQIFERRRPNRLVVEVSRHVDYLPKPLYVVDGHDFSSVARASDAAAYATSRPRWCQRPAA